MKNYIPGTGLCMLVTVPIMSIPFYLKLFGSLQKTTAVMLMLIIPMLILLPLSYFLTKPLYRELSNRIGAKKASVIDLILLLASTAFLVFFPMRYYIRG